MDKFALKIALEEVRRLKTIKELKALADYYFDGRVERKVIFAIEERLLSEFNYKYDLIVSYRRIYNSVQNRCKGTRSEISSI